MNRWIRPYGAPAPEAGATISPFASSFEVQAHYLARFLERAIDLIEFMWHDFMIEDDRMTQSTFFEGYATNGSLQYAPYGTAYPRLSYAHGWSTGPTSALSFYTGGFRLTTAMGKDWIAQPFMGCLNRVDMGLETPLGQFAAEWKSCPKGCVTGTFSTPTGTNGTLILPECENLQVRDTEDNFLRASSCEKGTLTFTNVPGGKYFISRA